MTLPRLPCLWCVLFCVHSCAFVCLVHSLDCTLCLCSQILPGGVRVPVLVRAVDTFGNTVEETVLATRTGVAPARLVAFTGCRAGLYECHGTISLDTPLAIVERYDGSTLFTNGTHPVEQVAFVADMEDDGHNRGTCSYWEAYATDLTEVRAATTCMRVALSQSCRSHAVWCHVGVMLVDGSRCWTKRCWVLVWRGGSPSTNPTT